MASDNLTNEQTQGGSGSIILASLTVILAVGIVLYALLVVPKRFELFASWGVELPVLSVVVLKYYQIMAGLAILAALASMAMMMSDGSSNVSGLLIACCVLVVIMALAMYLGMELPVWKLQAKLK